ncbi:MAG: hypothetical protein GY754_46765 [bacterium]|nr:hypothetical protein [bacterium]
MKKLNIRYTLILLILSITLSHCAKEPAPKPELTPRQKQFAQQALLEEYENVKNEIEQSRKQFHKRYRKTLRKNNSGDRQAVLAQARACITDSVIDLSKFWPGTPWNFYGSSSKPQEGTIACGYFVTTLLRHAGFRINRVRLAQQPASCIIDTFTTKKKIQFHYSNASIEKFNGSLEPMPRGIFIVGLDKHTGFIIKTGSLTYFLHASYYKPPLAVTEQAITAPSPLRDSKYRLLCNILLDDTVVTNWITGKKFPTKIFKPRR